jgi:hypothetical protein
MDFRASLDTAKKNTPSTCRESNVSPQPVTTLAELPWFPFDYIPVIAICLHITYIYIYIHTEKQNYLTKQEGCHFYTLLNDGSEKDQSVQLQKDTTRTDPIYNTSLILSMSYQGLFVWALLMRCSTKYRH